MTTRAVFFDMGGTIETFDYARELRLAATRDLQQLLRGAGIDLQLDDEALHDLISAGLTHYKQWSLVSMEELPPIRVWCDYVFAGVPMDPLKLEGIAEQLAFLVETRFYQRSMRPEMPAVLQALQDMGLKIGLISNVNSRGQVPVNLSQYGIRHYFDPIVLSSEYGRRKPDPAIFHYAARLARVPTSACIYVGDRISRDVLGACKAGFGLSVQILHDFDHGEDDAGAVPDHVITDMLELVEILKAERARPQRVIDRASIRAVLFDAGDVLYYRPNKYAAFKAFLEEVVPGAGPIPESEKDLLTERAYRGEINQEQYYGLLLRLYGITRPDQIERGTRILEQADDNLAFFPGVPETLAALKKRGFLLGVVTDTSNTVHAKLSWFESGGFGHVWDSIISSRELGTRKPDPAIYMAALDQLGVTARQALFVGHKITELDGARAVGIKTVAFNYEAGARADYFIEKFPDLLDVSILGLKS